MLPYRVQAMTKSGLKSKWNHRWNKLPQKRWCHQKKLEKTWNLNMKILHKWPHKRWCHQLLGYLMLVVCLPTSGGRSVKEFLSKNWQKGLGEKMVKVAVLKNPKSLNRVLHVHGSCCIRLTMLLLLWKQCLNNYLSTFGCNILAEKDRYAMCFCLFNIIVVSFICNVWTIIDSMSEHVVHTNCIGTSKNMWSTPI